MGATGTELEGSGLGHYNRWAMKQRIDRRTPQAKGASAEPRGAELRRFAKAAESLAEMGRAFYARGWVLGTSGNFSVVTSVEPLRLAITSTGLDKGELSAEQFLEIDSATKVVRGEG